MVKVNLPKVIRYTEIQSVIKRAGISVTLSGLTADTEVQAIVAQVEQAYADQNNITAKTQALAPPNGVLSDRFNSLVAAFNSGNSNANLKAVFDFLASIGEQINDFVNGGAGEVITLPDFLSDINAAITSNFDPVFEDIIALNLEAVADVTAAFTGSDFSALVAGTWPLASAATASNDISEANDNDRRMAAVNLVKPLFDTLNKAYQNLLVNAAGAYTKTLDESLALTFPVYKNILAGVGKSMTVMPPSGAVAGIYALDRQNAGCMESSCQCKSE
jgi:uncharacterized protein